MTRRFYPDRRCVNPRCRETIGPFVRVRICPSCAWAVRYAALAAFGISALAALARWLLS